MEAKIKIETVTIDDCEMLPEIKCKKEPIIDLVPALPSYLKTEPQVKSEEESSPRSTEADDTTLYGEGESPNTLPSHQPAASAFQGSLHSPDTAGVTVPALPTEARAYHQEVVLIDSDDEDTPEAARGDGAESGVADVADRKTVPPPTAGTELLNPPLKRSTDQSPLHCRSSPRPVRSRHSGSTSANSVTSRTHSAIQEYTKNSSPAGGKSVIEVVLTESDDEDTPEAVTDSPGYDNPPFIRVGSAERWRDPLDDSERAVPVHLLKVERAPETFQNYRTVEGHYKWCEGTRPKRTRRTYSRDQTLRLEMEYARCRFVERELKQHLAETLNLSERQIKIWYQNRRMKDKRIDKGDRDWYYRKAMFLSQRPPPPPAPSGAASGQPPPPANGTSASGQTSREGEVSKRPDRAVPQ